MQSMKCFLIVLMAATILALPAFADTPMHNAAPQNATPSGGNPHQLETPPGYYSIYWPAEQNWQPSIQKIDTETGRGTFIAALQIKPLPHLPGWLFVSPFGLTFDVDGTAYTMVNWFGFDSDPDHSWARFAKVNMMTGGLTYIGPLHNMNFAGPEIDGCGHFYITGFEVGLPEDPGGPPMVLGDSNLYRVNKQTGMPILIGDTGRTDWMDLDFDRKGRLWATTRNELYMLDTKTGASTFVTPIYGVPHSDIPATCAEDWPWMEVMSIAFDEKDVLWATAMRGFSGCSDNNAPVMTIDTRTGVATIVGYTGDDDPSTGGYNHGGDIVRIRQRPCKPGND